MAVSLRITAQQEDRFDQRRRVALLVGADVYQQGFPPLPTVAKDIAALDALLSAQWEPRNVTMLLGSDATKENIIKHMQMVASTVSPNDILLFYFGGHGSSDRSTDTSYLIATDSDPSNVSQTAISMEEVQQNLFAVPTRATIFIIDACYPNSRLPRGFSFSSTTPENVIGFMSAQPDEASYNLLEHGLFTYHLLEGLDGQADRSHKGFVTVFDLQQYVSRKVQDHAQALGLRQTPVLSYHGWEDVHIIQYSEENIQQEQKEAGAYFERMVTFANDREWQKVLDEWDKILTVAPDFERGFSTALEARQKLDSEVEYAAYARRDPSTILRYPRIWLCCREEAPIHYNVCVAHPDTCKGDILLEFEAHDDIYKIVCAHTAATNAFPGYSQGNRRVRYYVIPDESNRIDLTTPALTLSILQRRVTDQRMRAVSEEWDKFELWDRDIKAIGIWNEMRHALLREHTNQAENLLEAELEPLRIGLRKYSEASNLFRAAEDLFTEYAKLSNLNGSRFPLRKLESLMQHFWSELPRANIGSGGQPFESIPEEGSSVHLAFDQQIPVISAEQSVTERPDQLLATAPVSVTPFLIPAYETREQISSNPREGIFDEDEDGTTAPQVQSRFEYQPLFEAPLAQGSELASLAGSQPSPEAPQLEFVQSASSSVPTPADAQPQPTRSPGNLAPTQEDTQSQSAQSDSELTPTQPLIERQSSQTSIDPSLSPADTQSQPAQPPSELASVPEQAAPQSPQTSVDPLPAPADTQSQSAQPPIAETHLDRDKMSTDHPILLGEQRIWQTTIIQNIQRPPDKRDTQALEIHIMADHASQALQEEGVQIPEQYRRYEVVLTFSKRIDNHLEQSRCEGPLLPLNLENKPLGLEYGAALFHAVFNQVQPENTYRQLRGEKLQEPLLYGFIGAYETSKNAEGLRIQLRINNASPEMHRYKWEYLCERYHPLPLACNPYTPFARVMHVSSEGDIWPQISPDTPLNILMAMASPNNLNTDPRVRELLQGHAGLQPIGHTETDALKNGLMRIGALVAPLEDKKNLLASPDCVSLDAICQRLEEARDSGKPFHVLHILCHGIIKKDGECYLLLHRSDSDRVDLVTDEEFATKLYPFVRHDLRLVVLASCFTALSTEHHALKGIARKLIEEGFPAVVAMQDPFEFKAAQYFSQRLYAQLAHHGKIDLAVNAARRELYNRAMKDSQDVSLEQWGIPVLFMRLPDGKLFEVATEASEKSNPEAETQAELPPGYLNRPHRVAASTIVDDAADQLQLPLPVTIPQAQTSSGPANLLNPATASTDTHEAPAQTDTLEILFGREDQQDLRRALVQAAREHRQHPARCSILFLRGLSRREIAQRLHFERFDALSPEEFHSHIWDGGQVLWGDKVIENILEGGPEPDKDLLDAANRPIRISDWRSASRKLDGSEDEITFPKFTLVGNLIWSDESRPSKEDGRKPDRSDLKKLLSDKEDVFTVFNVLTGDDERQKSGLDERCASLMLHATYPDLYVPYYHHLAERVLELLEQEKQNTYKGFKGYCRLAHILLNDNKLGFESLVDVSYFLQRLCDGNVTFEKGQPSISQTTLRAANLWAEQVDSEMVLHRVVLEQATTALNAGKHVVLIGPPGTGKTTLAEDLCRHARDRSCNHGHILVTATADWTTFDTIGGYMPETNGHLAFQPGIFLEAIEAQKWLIIDEMNRADIDKAFGELFTVLSGQLVTLPHKKNGKPIRILPARNPASTFSNDYTVHSSWRIIGCINAYDKASLFAMSHAFMRRFAFIDVPIPSDQLYRRLLQHFWESTELAQHSKTEAWECFYKFFSQENHLMRCRPLGPAIAKDVVAYLSQRASGYQQNGNHLIGPEHVAEALLLYAAPQLDGLDREHILQVYQSLKSLFEGHNVNRELPALLRRVEENYPFITSEEWNKKDGR